MKCGKFRSTTRQSVPTVLHIKECTLEDFTGALQPSLQNGRTSPSTRSSYQRTIGYSTSHSCWMRNSHDSHDSKWTTTTTSKWTIISETSRQLRAVNGIVKLCVPMCQGVVMDKPSCFQSFWPKPSSLVVVSAGFGSPYWPWSAEANVQVQGQEQDSNSPPKRRSTRKICTHNGAQLTIKPALQDALLSIRPQ